MFKAISSALLSVGLSGSAFAEGTAAPAAAQSSFQPIIMLVIFVGVFFLLFILPQMRRNKAMRNLLNTLNKGDEVLTTGGIIGRIEKVTDGYVELALNDTVVIKIQKQAIASMVPKGTLKSV